MLVTAESALAPAWVQAAAALLSFAVTAWLAYLTLRSVRAADRMAASAQSQVDTVIEAGRRNQHGVAASLREEARRIRSELGPRPENDLAVAIGGVIPPQVHPWFRPIVPQIAQTDAAIVGLFLQLDRDLHNYRVSARRLSKARRELDEKRVAREGLKDFGESAEGKDVTAWGNAEQDVRVAEMNVETALGQAAVTYRGASTTLDQLETALDKVVAGLGPADTTPAGHPAVANTRREETKVAVTELARREYETALGLMQHEGSTMWQIVATLMVPQTLLLGVVAAGLQEITKGTDPHQGLVLLLVMGSLGGVLLTVLWRSAYERHNWYYRLRIHQAQALEKDAGYDLLTTGYRFGRGEAVGFTMPDGRVLSLRMPLLTGKRLSRTWLSDQLGARLLTNVFLVLFGVLFLVSLALCWSVDGAMALGAAPAVVTFLVMTFRS